MLRLDHLVSEARTVGDEDFQLGFALLLVFVEQCFVRVQTGFAFGVTGFGRHADPFQFAFQCFAAQYAQLFPEGFFTELPFFQFLEYSCLMVFVEDAAGIFQS